MPFLLDTLFKIAVSAPHHVSLVLQIGLIAKSEHRLDEFVDVLKQQNDPRKRFRIPSDAVLKGYLDGYDDEHKSVFTKIKYANVPAWDTPHLMVQSAGKLAPQIDVDLVAMTHVFNGQRHCKLGKEDWFKQVRVATAIEHLCHDVPDSRAFVLSAMHPNAPKIIDEACNTKKGLLVVIGHMAFSNPRNVLFNEFVDDVAIVGKGETDAYIQINLFDPAATLFACIKALLQQRRLLLAPDGPVGKKTSAITVLGKNHPIGGGAALMAFETKTPVIWFHVSCEDGVFVPNFTEGPIAEKGETFSDFEKRFLAFYQDCVDAYFQSDPQNIFFRRNWSKVFATMA